MDDIKRRCEKSDASEKTFLCSTIVASANELKMIQAKRYISFLLVDKSVSIFADASGLKSKADLQFLKDFCLRYSRLDL